MRIALKHRKCEVTRHRGNTGAMVFTLFLALLCVLTIFLVRDSLDRRPNARIAHIIGESAAQEEVSPALLEAVILTESKFDEDAVSHVGAVGLMQLMPETAAWISEQSGLPADALSKPEQNIPLGAWYINYLLKKYRNNEVLALAAYNAGRGNVDEWMQQEGWDEGFSDMDRIPFPETREFVKTVISSRDRLQEEMRKEAENGR